MKTVSRKQWGALPPKKIPSALGQVSYVIIHHDAGSSPTSEIAEAARMRADQNFHQATGYNDIAYAFGIGPSGKVYEGRGWGVLCGATENWNEKSVPIMFMGNYEIATPTKKQLQKAGKLIRQGIERGHLTKNPNVIGHRDTKATACPGAHLYAKLGAIKKYSKPPPKIFTITATKAVEGWKKAKRVLAWLRKRGFTTTKRT